jgi:hypothetical protein
MPFPLRLAGWAYERLWYPSCSCLSSVSYAESMPLSFNRTHSQKAFTFVDICMSVVVSVIFAVGAYATNQRLLVALKGQKETAAATMMLQQRKECLRSTAFLNIANQSYTNYLHDHIFSSPTGSEAPLGSLSEKVTVDAYPTATGSPLVLLRDPAHPNCQIVSNNDLSSQNLLRVDILLNWTSANGRTRTRQFSEVFGHGNSGY